jgi:hypothetical protein
VKTKQEIDQNNIALQVQSKRDISAISELFLEEKVDGLYTLNELRETLGSVFFAKENNKLYRFQFLGKVKDYNCCGKTDWDRGKPAQYLYITMDGGGSECVDCGCTVHGGYKKKWSKIS